MNIAILCENVDESIFLMEQIKKINKAFSVKVFPGPDALQKELRSGGRFELFFVDMDHRIKDSFDLMQEIRKISPKALTVCLTTSSYVILKCNEHVWKYIIKPYRVSETGESLIKAQRILAPQMLLLPQSAGREYVMLNVHTIIYFEMYDKCGVVHTVDHKEYQFRTTLSDLERRLKENSFCRSHKSYLLNIEHIRHISDETITMVDGSSVPLSRNRKGTFYKQLSEHAEIIFV